MRNESPEVQIILDYVHKVRKDHSIIPGPFAKGLESEDYGEIGQLVNDDLVRSPDFTGRWQQLADPEVMARAVSFVQGELARRQHA